MRPSRAQRSSVTLCSPRMGASSAAERGRTIGIAVLGATALWLLITPSVCTERAGYLVDGESRFIQVERKRFPLGCDDVFRNEVFDGFERQLSLAPHSLQHVPLFGALVRLLLQEVNYAL